jgi:membrane dipeptidase
MNLKKLLIIFLPATMLMANGNANEYLEQARKIHEKIVTIDTHTDTPMLLGRNDFDLGRRGDPNNRGGKVDFPRMAEGGLDAAFFAVFLGQGESTPEAYAVAKERALTTFDLIHNSLEANKDVAGLALMPEDALRLKKEGKRAIYIGLENGYPIGEDLSMVKEFYNLGARYITLCHTRNNHFSDSSNDPNGALHGGLSDLGRELVKIMNQMGMMIDVSHISDEAFRQVIQLSKAPVIASHSNARAINDDPRNMSDEMLKALAKNGGVVQLCFLYVKNMPPNPPRDSARAELRAKYNQFQGLSDEEMENARAEWFNINQKYPSELATVADLIDHLDHIVKLIGIDHVGIGSDFDGGGELKDCYDVSQMHNITAEMLRRNYSHEDIEKVWSGNFMRVFRKNQELSNL